MKIAAVCIPEKLSLIETGHFMLKNYSLLSSLLIGAMQVADAGAASVKAAETASGVDELEGDGSPSGKKKILPYTDDLDYLEDNFKLVIILLK